MGTASQARAQKHLASPPAANPPWRGELGSYRCCWALGSHGHVVICLGATPKVQMNGAHPTSASKGERKHVFFPCGS